MKRQVMENKEKICQLERKIIRIETLLWYIAGTLSIKFGSELLPLVTALLN